MANAFFAKPGTASELPGRGWHLCCVCLAGRLPCWQSRRAYWNCIGHSRQATNPHPPTREAVVEVFTAGWTWQVHRIWLDQEARPQLQWWALTVDVSAAGWGPRGVALLSWLDARHAACCGALDGVHAGLLGAGAGPDRLCARGAGGADAEPPAPLQGALPFSTSRAAPACCRACSAQRKCTVPPEGSGCPCPAP